jgi:serine/threonine protein phosphatase PrpC
MTMEDEYMIADGGRFVAVFDGHGGNGVSRYLKQNLYRTMKQHLHRKYWEDSELHNGIVEVNSKHQTNTISLQDNESRPNRHGWFDKVLWNNNTTDESSTAAAPVATSQSSMVPSVASYVAALRSAFAEIEANVVSNDEFESQGSTAVAVIVHESDDGHRTILSANVGDSRAILCRNNTAVDLTRDHKPNDTREKARIFAMGETIEWDRIARVHRVRTLSLSRAIGDRYAKPVVSSDVEIAHYPIPTLTTTDNNVDNDDFILLASDGLWDVMSSNDVAQYVKSVMDSKLQQQTNNKNDNQNYKFLLRKQMAKSVAQEALKRGSADNVCVIMVWLRDL